MFLCNLDDNNSICNDNNISNLHICKRPITRVSINNTMQTDKYFIRGI